MTLQQQNSFLSNVVKLRSVVITNNGGVTVDILNQVRSIEIHESIYVNTITGIIDIVDSNDLPQFLPIIGEETITIDIILPGVDVGVYMLFENMRIYKISDRVIVNDKIQNYKLWFTSKETISNYEIKSSRKWSSKTTNSIVKDAFDLLGSSKAINIETTVGVQNYISTNFSPFQILNYLASTRSINKSKLSDFLFFENFDYSNHTTKFNFVSLGTLCSSDPIAELIYRPGMVSNVTKGNVQPNNVVDIRFSKGFDILESKVAGMYNQTFLYYDLLRKKYVVQKNNYDEIFEESKNSRIDGEKSNKVISKNSNTPMECLKFVYVTSFPSKISTSKEINNVVNKGVERRAKRSTNTWISANGTEDDKSSNLMEETLGRRRVLLQEFENNKIFLNDLSGNYKYTVGSTVMFNKPHITIMKEDTNVTSGSKYDRFISGKYLIMKTLHVINLEATGNWMYRTSLEVSKNSFLTKLT